jgi:ABC-type Fe3+-hydroxamate transport system substrate-binding protein
LIPIVNEHYAKIPPSLVFVHIVVTIRSKNERYRYTSLIVVVVESDYGSSVEGMVDHVPRVGLWSVAPPSHKK